MVGTNNAFRSHGRHHTCTLTTSLQQTEQLSPHGFLSALESVSQALLFFLEQKRDNVLGLEKTVKELKVSKKDVMSKAVVSIERKSQKIAELQVSISRLRAELEFYKGKEAESLREVGAEGASRRRGAAAVAGTSGRGEGNHGGGGALSGGTVESGGGSVEGAPVDLEFRGGEETGQAVGPGVAGYRSVGAHGGSVSIHQLMAAGLPVRSHSAAGAAAAGKDALLGHFAQVSKNWVRLLSLVKGSDIHADSFFAVP